MEEKLEQIHNHINELLKFAEAKNAGLLAFNGIIILEGIKNFYQDQHIFLSWNILILIYIVLFNIASFIICLGSIIPSHQSKIHKSVTKNISNLLFYKTIASLSVTEYYDQFNKRYGIKAESKEYCFDLIRQLIIQSQILLSKFNKFKYASLFTFCAFATPLAYFIYIRIFNNNEIENAK